MLSCFSGWFLYKMEEKAILNEFRKEVNGRVASLYREISLNLETLRALAILFNGDNIPEFEKFRLESQNILSRHSDIQALEWIQQVNHAERVQYESKYQHLYPGFAITERTTQGYLVPAEERPEYFPAYYVDPVIDCVAPLGFDFASSPQQFEALKRVRDTAMPLVVSSRDVVQVFGDEKVFLAFLPIYKGVSSTVNTRRKNLRGFVAAIFPVSAIFEGSALSLEPKGIEMQLVDETAAAHDDILHIHKSRTGFVAYEGIAYRKELPVIWGLKLSLLASPTLRYMDDKRDSQPLLIFTAGILATFFIVFYLNSIARRNVVIEQIVVEKTKELHEANRKLKRLSRTDSLTGIANRRYMDEFLDKEWQGAIRNQASISFVLMDIDSFKLYNDNYGHPAGDECLKQVAAALKGVVHRPGDLLARYGGEEFALVLADTGDAEFVAESCRRSIEELHLAHEYSTVADIVTISVGFCTIVPGQKTSPSLIIDYADKALYKAKMGGKNRIDSFEWRHERSN